MTRPRRCARVGIRRGFPGRLPDPRRTAVERMGHLALILIVLGLLASCATMPPDPQTATPTRRLEGDLDVACEAAIRVLGERGYDLRSVDRTAGVIETDWLTTNPDYAASVFVTERQDRYSDCGKPGLGRAFRTKQTRLRVMLSPNRRGETDLRIDAAFRTRRYSSFLFIQGKRPLGERPCRSRGHLEEELALQMKLWTLGEQLERFRRGTP